MLRVRASAVRCDVVGALVHLAEHAVQHAGAPESGGQGDWREAVRVSVLQHVGRPFQHKGKDVRVTAQHGAVEGGAGAHDTLQRRQLAAQDGGLLEGFLHEAIKGLPAVLRRGAQHRQQGLQ